MRRWLLLLVAAFAVGVVVSDFFVVETRTQSQVASVPSPAPPSFPSTVSTPTRSHPPTRGLMDEQDEWVSAAAELLGALQRKSSRPSNVSIGTLPTLPTWSEEAVRLHRMLRRIEYRCSDRRLIGGRPDGDGVWPLCFDFLSPDSRKSTAMNDSLSCTVMSLGSNNEFSFDDSMAALGCVVHTFDHTVGWPVGPRRRGERVFLHGLGITSKRTGAPTLTQHSRAEASAASSGRLRRLEGLMEAAGVHGIVDVLKMDVEGHEWASFDSVLALARAGRVNHFLVEIHFWPKFLRFSSTGDGVPPQRYGLHSKASTAAFAQLLGALAEEFALFGSHLNPNSATSWMPAKTLCCWELYFVRRAIVEKRRQNIQSLARGPRFDQRVASVKHKNAEVMSPSTLRYRGRLNESDRTAPGYLRPGLLFESYAQLPEAFVLPSPLPLAPADLATSVFTSPLWLWQTRSVPPRSLLSGLFSPSPSWHAVDGDLGTFAETEPAAETALELELSPAGAPDVLVGFPGHDATTTQLWCVAVYNRRDGSAAERAFRNLRVVLLDAHRRTLFDSGVLNPRLPSAPVLFVRMNETSIALASSSPIRFVRVAKESPPTPQLAEALSVAEVLLFTESECQTPRRLLLSPQFTDGRLAERLEDQFYVGFSI